MDIHDHATWGMMLIAAVILFIMALWTIHDLRNRSKKKQRKARFQELKKLKATSKSRVFVYDYEEDEFYRFDKTGQLKNAEQELLFLGKLSDTVMFVREKAADILSGKLPKQVLFLNEHNFKNENVLKLTIQKMDQQNASSQNKVLITLHDVTEGYRMQSEHQSIHALYNAAFTTMTYSVIFYDRHGKIEDLNDLAVSDLGAKSKEEVLASDWTLQNIFNVPTPADDMQQISQCVLGLDDNYYETVITPMFDDQHHVTGAFSVCRNINYLVEMEHKHKENIRKIEDMQQQMNRYLDQTDTVLKDNSIELLVYDPKTHYISLRNKFMEESAKVSVLEVLTWIPEEERDKMMNMWRIMDNYEDTPVSGVYTTYTSHDHGKEKIRRISYIPIKDKHGKITHYSGMAVDVTEGVKIDRQIEKAYQVAQENEKIKNIFLKNVSADVQTPINTVLDNVELLSHDLSDEDLQQGIRAIHDNSMHLLDVVNDVLYYSRLEANRVEIKKADVDFGAQIESICQQAMDGIEGIGLTVKNPYEHLVIDMDIPNFTQIMRFVLKMISRFMSQGNVVIACRYHNESLIIEVDTDGEGLTDEMKQTIDSIIAGNDDPDVVSNHLTATVIVKLVKLMGGRLDLQTDTGMGSTGWIIIPCTAKEITKKKND